MSKLKQNYQSLDPDERSGVWWGVAAIAAIAALAILDSPVFPDVQSVLERFPRVVDLASGALALAAAFAFILTGKAMRTRRVNEAVTSVGLAGLVRPLLGVEYVISGILAGQTSKLVKTKETYEALNGKRSPLKWTRGPVLVLGPDLMNPQARWTLSPEDQEPARRLVDECIREVVGSVRNWTDTLVLTELGQQSLFSIQSLRSDLQLVEYLLRRPGQGTGTATEKTARLGQEITDWIRKLLGMRAAPAATSAAPLSQESTDQIHHMLTVLRNRVLFLAAAFEVASMPRNVRSEVVDALKRWPGESQAPPVGLPKAYQLAEHNLVDAYIKTLRETNNLGEPAEEAVRKDRRIDAEIELQEFYLSQDHAKVKSNTK